MPPSRTTSPGRSFRFIFSALAAVVVALVAAGPAEAQSLSGSWASMNKQVQEAARHDYTYIRNPSQLASFVEAGYLVPVRGNEHYYLKEVSFPYARQEVKEFIELVAEEYHHGCDEQLVVTSLTRPKNRQPRNASRRSVHPTGMALDLRRSWNSKCRRLLEQMLLRFEAYGVIEATLERRPYHYHLAVFPRIFRQRGEHVLSDDLTGEYFVLRGDVEDRPPLRHLGGDGQGGQRPPGHHHLSRPATEDPDHRALSRSASRTTSGWPTSAPICASAHHVA